MRENIMRIKFLAIGLLLFLASGCALTRAGIASFRSTSHFVKLDSDSRVLYEPGAEENARLIGSYLAKSIATVEREQFMPFAEEVQVYVCASQESYESFTGQEGTRAALTSMLFLSGSLKDNPENIPLLLTRELSHLHIQQRLGKFHVIADMPPWFLEGLSVLISGGGGAEKVSEAEAARSILAGKRFIPGTSGGLFPRKYGDAFGLEPHMFYRQ